MCIKALLPAYDRIRVSSWQHSNRCNACYAIVLKQLFATLKDGVGNGDLSENKCKGGKRITHSFKNHSSNLTPQQIADDLKKITVTGGKTGMEDQKKYPDDALDVFYNREFLINY
ncbi:MAG: hypothetical protein WBG71_09490 [Leeuwenhoekiella sp.]